MNRLILLTAFALLFIASPAIALVNGEAPGKEDTRFDAVAAFSRTNWLIDNPEDKHVHNWFGNGVLIAPDVVLIAKHLLPHAKQAPKPGSMAVRFRRHEEGSLGSIKKSPDAYHQVSIGRWILSDRFDLALGILAKPVDHIEPVRVLLQSDPLKIRPAILAAWGGESKWRGKAWPRLGLKYGKNTVSSRRSFLSVDSYKTEIRENQEGQRKPFIIDENAVPNMHDSGGSMFILDDDDKPVLAGIISTYTGGTYLPAAVEAGFPLEAATRGAKALLQAIDDAKNP